MSKRAFTLNEQIKILSERGMCFDNIPKAKEILGDIGYYRFGFFSFPFEKSYPKKVNRTHELVKGTTFKQVYELYSFDTALRFILTKALTRIEINVRTRITHLGSLKFLEDPWWFCNPKFMKKNFLKNFDREVYESVKKNPVIQDHHANHPKDKYAPAWKTMEFMTLGNIIFLFEAIKDENLKKEIAKHYGYSVKVFINYLETIRLIRNRCAHGGCLYNLNVDKGINRKPAMVENKDAHNIKGAILVILYFLGKISERHQSEILDEILTEIGRLNTEPVTLQVIKKCTNLDENFKL